MIYEDQKYFWSSKLFSLRKRTAGYQTIVNHLSLLYYYCQLKEIPNSFWKSGCQTYAIFNGE